MQMEPISNLNNGNCVWVVVSIWVTLYSFPLLSCAEAVGEFCNLNYSGSVARLNRVSRNAIGIVPSANRTQSS